MLQRFTQDSTRSTIRRSFTQAARPMVLRVLCCLALGAANAAGSEVTYHVALDGNDENPGTQDQPFRSMHRAQQAVRKLLKEASNEPGTVVIHPGTYFQEQHLCLLWRQRLEPGVQGQRERLRIRAESYRAQYRLPRPRGHDFRLLRAPLDEDRSEPLLECSGQGRRTVQRLVVADSQGRGQSRKHFLGYSAALGRERFARQAAPVYRACRRARRADASVLLAGRHKAGRVLCRLAPPGIFRYNGSVPYAPNRCSQHSWNHHR